MGAADKANLEARGALTLASAILAWGSEVKKRGPVGQFAHRGSSYRRPASLGGTASAGPATSYGVETPIS